ncbi:MAG: hypothetical protein L0H36_03455 [bacterium]|nr:hypothetical protein [bacterium]
MTTCRLAIGCRVLELTSHDRAAGNKSQARRVGVKAIVSVVARLAPAGPSIVSVSPPITLAG